MKILGICGEYHAVSWYRIISPIGEYGGDLTFKLDEGGKIVNIGEIKKNIDEHGEDFMKQYDLVIVKYLATREDAMSVMKWKANAPDTILLVDVDDNVFEIPDENYAETIWGEDEQAIFAHMAKEADGIICSTRPLQKYFSGLNPHTYLAPNRVNPDFYKEIKKDEGIKIGWTYARTHKPDIAIIEGALKKIMKKYPDVVVETTGSGIEGTVDIPGITFALYPKWLCEKKWDIALGPLVDNDFNRGKSNIKWLESTLAGSVFVGSDVYPYTNSIVHGKTGFLAKSEADWVKILSMLIEDKQLRKDVQKNAKKVVMKEYNIKRNNPIKSVVKGVLGH